MSEQQSEKELFGWLSTYGIITAERVLERYRIKLKPEDLLHALKTTDSFYQKLLRIPLRNVFNGIILQQARDYQIYAQKLFIDYLLSGESGKMEEAPGGRTREELEERRQNLVKLSDKFHSVEQSHEKLISSSQASLIKSVENWQKAVTSVAKEIKISLAAHALIKSESTITEAIVALLSNYNLKDNLDSKNPIWLRLQKIMDTELTPKLQQIFRDKLSQLTQIINENEETWYQFYDEVKIMSRNLKEFRNDFYHYILKVNQLIRLLPEYRADDSQMKENKEALHFDSSLGGSIDG